jgi:hypothetical protein
MSTQTVRGGPDQNLLQIAVFSPVHEYQNLGKRSGGHGRRKEHNRVKATIDETPRFPFRGITWLMNDDREVAGA